MRFRTLIHSILLAGAAVLSCAPATAQNERELRAAAEKLRAMQRKAQELVGAGKFEAAHETLEHCVELRNHILEAKRRHDQRKGADDHHGLFHHLEGAIHALRKLGRTEDAKRLLEFAKKTHGELSRRGRREPGEREHGEREHGEREHGEREHGERERREREHREGHDRERGEREHRERREGERRERERRDGARREQRREIAQHELKMLRHAKGVYRDAKNEKLLELVERSMHARELQLAGRRDKEAQRIIHARPKPGQEIEVIAYASNLAKKQGKAELAVGLKRLADTMLKRYKAQKEKKPTEREVAEQQVKALLYAAEVLAKAKKHDAADIVKRAGVAIRFRLAGARSKEARAAYERAPKREQTYRFLRLAAEVDADRGQKEHAQWLVKMSNYFRPRERRREREAHEEHEEEIEEVEETEEIEEEEEVEEEVLTEEVEAEESEELEAEIEELTALNKKLSRKIRELEKALADLRAAQKKRRDNE